MVLFLRINGDIPVAEALLPIKPSLGSAFPIEGETFHFYNDTLAEKLAGMYRPEANNRHGI
jgi:hypothetical protein